MTVSAGHLDSLLNTSVSFGNYNAVTLTDYTSSTTSPATLAVETVTTTGQPGPSAMSGIGEAFFISAVDNTANTIVLEGFDGNGTNIFANTVYVVGYASGALLVDFRSSASSAGLLASGQSTDGSLGLITASPPATGTSFTLSATGSYTGAVACFARGTRLATARGDVAVEDLGVGDIVRTRFAGLAPVTWIGRSTVDCRRHARPLGVTPVRVQAGAFAEGVPRRDVLLSPGHAVFAQDVLIPVAHLINDATVAYEPDAATVIYYHVEVPEHDVVFADGLPTETYLDDGNRTAFETATIDRLLVVDHTPSSWERACAPKCEAGPTLDAARRQLRHRLAELGWRPVRHPFEVWADGARLLPVAAGRVTVPPNVTEVRLRCPTGVPAHLDGADDPRRLGLRLAALVLDGVAVKLDSAMLTSGFYGIETGEHGQWRWTDGDAVLALPPHPTARLLELRVDDLMPHWSPPPARAIAA